MKKLLFSCAISGAVITGSAHGQIPYIDVLTAPAMLEYAGMLKKQQEETNGNLSAIQKGQVVVMGQLQVANDLHQKLVNGLTQISGTLRNALTVKEIYDCSTDVLASSKKAVELAAGNPALVLFATKASGEFRRRAIAMTVEVGRILTGGESNMMDAGERQKLLNYVHTEIRLLAATAYAVQYEMYYAKMNGVWNSLNPFRAWVNNDVAIMREIIEQAKRL